MALLRLQGHRRDRPCFQAGQRDRVARYFAISIFALVEATDRGIDLGDQLSLTVAGAELEAPVGFTRSAVGDVGLTERIDLQLRPAIETLDELIAEGKAGSFDFAFIDADKENYDAYYERTLVLLRPGGLVAIDNVLWGGAVADPLNRKESTEAIRRLNRKLAADRRVAISMVPIGDGLTLARKLP